MSPGLPSDRDFVAALKSAVDRYFRSIDSWEAAYRKYYRMPGYASQVSSDLEPEQREFEECRRALQAMVPRARGLCFKYGFREPWTALVRTRLGEFAPQQRNASALCRTERLAVNECLMLLATACKHWDEEPDDVAAPPPRAGSLLKRIMGYFY
jgi:hypothetical protein